MPPAEEPLIVPLARVQSFAPVESRPAGPPASPYSYGSFSLKPHLSYRFIRAEGLQVTPGQATDTEINTFSFGLQADVGPHWTLDYTPTWTSYTAKAYRDTLDHAANLRGATSYGNWAFHLSENFAVASPILVETASQTKQRTWATEVGTAYTFGPALQLRSIADLNERYADTEPDTREWSTTHWLTYRYSPQLDFGIGLGLGYVDIVAQPDMKYQRYLARFNWRLSEKLTLGAEGGVDLRQSRSAAAADMHDPILQATVTYQPFSVTKLTVGHSRAVANSFYDAQVTASNGWNANLEQRLLGKLFLNAGYNRQTVAYTGMSAISGPPRDDHLRNFNARLTTAPMLKRWTAALIYQRSQNRSSLALFDFTSSQYGFELGCRY